MLHLHERNVRTLQGFQCSVSITIVVLTIDLGEEGQCDPYLSFLLCKQHDGYVGGETRDQLTEPPTFQPLSQSRQMLTVPSRFIGSVSLKMFNVDHLIVNGDVYRC